MNKCETCPTQADCESHRNCWNGLQPKPEGEKVRNTVSYTARYIEEVVPNPVLGETVLTMAEEFLRDNPHLSGLIQADHVEQDADQKLYDEKVAQVKQCQAVIIDLQRQLNVLEAKEKEWEALIEKEKELSHWAAAEARRQEADWLDDLLITELHDNAPISAPQLCENLLRELRNHIAELRKEGEPCPSKK